MNIGVIAFGGAGGRIADALRHVEKRTRKSIIETVFVADTAQEPLKDIQQISDDYLIQLGLNKFGGRGTAGKLDEALPVAKQDAPNLIQRIYNTTTPVHDIDIFLVIAALGRGTGGSTAPVFAQQLAEATNVPVHGVAVLPATCEPDQYTYNAARAVQSFHRETAALVLVDNDHLGVAEPRHAPDVSDETARDEMFEEVNRELARALHLLLSANQTRTPSGLDGTFLSKAEVFDVLAAGGMATVGYADATLPRVARPGIGGRFWRLVDRTTPGQPREYPPSEATTAESPATGEDSTDVREGEPVLEEREWPHPTSLVPETMTAGGAMVRCEPNTASQTLHILVGPKIHLTKRHPIEAAKWIEANSHARKVVVGNYPYRTKHVRAVGLCAGLGLPNRIAELQRKAVALVRQADHAVDLPHPDVQGFERLDEVVPPVN